MRGWSSITQPAGVGRAELDRGRQAQVRPQVQCVRRAPAQGLLRALGRPLLFCTLRASPAYPQIPPYWAPFFLTPRLFYLQCAGSRLFPCLVAGSQAKAWVSMDP